MTRTQTLFALLTVLLCGATTHAQVFPPIDPNDCYDWGDTFTCAYIYPNHQNDDCNGCPKQLDQNGNWTGFYICNDTDGVNNTQDPSIQWNQPMTLLVEPDEGDGHTPVGPSVYKKCLDHWSCNYYCQLATNSQTGVTVKECFAESGTSSGFDQWGLGDPCESYGGGYGGP